MTCGLWLPLLQFSTTIPYFFCRRRIEAATNCLRSMSVRTTVLHLFFTVFLKKLLGVFFFCSSITTNRSHRVELPPSHRPLSSFSNEKPISYCRKRTSCSREMENPFSDLLLVCVCRQVCLSKLQISFAGKKRRGEFALQGVTRRKIRIYGKLHLLPLTATPIRNNKPRCPCPSLLFLLFRPPMQLHRASRKKFEKRREEEAPPPLPLPLPPILILRPTIKAGVEAGTRLPVALVLPATNTDYPLENGFQSEFLDFIKTED